ncbi:hypothetical protein [Vibrio metschnikovii]|uniref:hypothetical protein n=2 Tax=Bacteria TaxID=2 RepID=UPI001C30D482|nr:hypothetical protein [Vibrio metschnikovii]
MFKQTAVALGVSALLSGCISMGPVPICTPDTSVPLLESEVPAKSSQDVKAIVLPVDVNFKDVAQDRVQSVIRNSLESQIVETGTELVDRKLANKLKGEIKLAEQSGRYNTKGVPIADYAVLTEVTNLDFSKSFSEARSYKNKKGETVHVPAKCSYKMEVAGIVKVVSLPDMTLVKRIDIKGDEYASTETRNSSCPINDAAYQGLASKAAVEAVEHSAELKSLLAARTSVLELRQCESGSMVKIGVGSDKNIQPKDEIAFSKIMKSEDGELETFGVGKGTIVNNPEHGIKAKFSWVTIDEETALKIRKGDQAQVVLDPCKSWLDLECKFKNL